MTAPSPTLLIDSLFAPNRAIHASGGREGFEPRYVHWSRVRGPIDHDRPRTLWLTDSDLLAAAHYHDRGHRTIGLLLEPPQLHPENYQLARELIQEDVFDFLFTSHPEMFEASPEVLSSRVHSYPLGGTRVHTSDWGNGFKSSNVSIVASSKRTLPGHTMRHRVIARMRDLGLALDAYGPEYVPITDKAEALTGYAFHVAIEPVDTGLWFSETLLDPLLTFTMPIYWGSLEALKWWGFDPGGVLWVSDEDHLIECLRDLSSPAEAKRIYESALPAMRRNFIRAHAYTCPEDWLWRSYPQLFGDTA